MHSLAYTLERGEDEIDIEVEYSVSAYYPAKISGPPEDCYPAEGGEIETLTAYRDGQAIDLTPTELEAVETHIYNSHDY